VIGPAPAGLELTAADCGVAEGEDFDFAFAVFEDPYLIGLGLGFAN
jgi:hypothetical protein